MKSEKNETAKRVLLFPQKIKSCMITVSAATEGIFPKSVVKVNIHSETEVAAAYSVTTPDGTIGVIRATKRMRNCRAFVVSRNR